MRRESFLTYLVVWKLKTKCKNIDTFSNTDYSVGEIRSLALIIICSHPQPYCPPVCSSYRQANTVEIRHHRNARRCIRDNNMMCSDGTTWCITLWSWVVNIKIVAIPRNLDAIRLRGPGPRTKWGGWCDHKEMIRANILLVDIWFNFQWSCHCDWVWWESVGSRWVQTDICIISTEGSCECSVCSTSEGWKKSYQHVQKVYGLVALLIRIIIIILERLIYLLLLLYMFHLSYRLG